MNENKFSRESYLERIRYSGYLSTTVDSLAAIQESQLQTIPFENFDICLNRKIFTTPSALLNKLIGTRRGGYCFELNGLLLMALQSFGFEARALLARVHISGKPTGRGHQISLVNINGKPWIVDVGFGADTPSIPMPLTINVPVSNNGQTFRLTENELFGFMLQCKNGEIWKDLYSFELNHVCLGDIEYGNHFASTSKKTIFTHARVAAIQVPNGVVTLLNHTVKKSIEGKEILIRLEENESYIQALETHFGIELDAGYNDLKPITDLTI